MTERRRDFDVITGWEKRIKVDFGSIGPNHTRWSDWTHKERDIVARKVHESTGISRDHGPRSRQMEDWSAENAPIMIGFSRDGGPMPDWAHAEFRESGVPEYVQVVWQRENPDDMASPADWAYDPPAPWTDKGAEPAWSARPKQPDHDPNDAYKARQWSGGFNHHDLEWREGKLVFPITDIFYPSDKDELLGMALSNDPTRGGWVTMSALEALGSGLASSRTETVRDATDITFVVPMSYNIQDRSFAHFKLYFRKSNGGRQKPEYMEYDMAIPTEGPRQLDTSGGMHSKYGGVISYQEKANGDHVASDGTVISTRESRAKEDVPDWRKFELGRLEEVDNIILPGPNALPQDEAKFGGNRRFSKRHQVKVQSPDRNGPDPDRIMPDDPNYSPVEKAGSWAEETHHGPRHQERWRRVAAALGSNNGASPMSFEEAEGLWERFGRNKRWTMAVNAIEGAEAATFAAAAHHAEDIEAANRYREAVGLPPVEQSEGEKLRDALVKTNARPDVVVKEFDPVAGHFVEIKVSEDEKRRRELDFYESAPAMQGHFTVEEWRRMNGSEPTVVLVKGWNRLAILDPALGIPNYWLEGEGEPTQEWVHDDGDEWALFATRVMMGKTGPDGEDGPVGEDGPLGDMGEPGRDFLEVPAPWDMGKAIEAGDWELVAKLALERAVPKPEAHTPDNPLPGFLRRDEPMPDFKEKALLGKVLRNEQVAHEGPAHINRWKRARWALFGPNPGEIVSMEPLTAKEARKFVDMFGGDWGSIAEALEEREKANEG